MDLNFAAILPSLGPDAAFRIINQARPPADYLFNTFLPERVRATYDAKAGSMTIRATMAGMVGMDSPYPPGGAVEGRVWHEQTAKIAQHVPLPEALLRELHQLLQAVGNDVNSDEVMTRTILNFIDKVLVQAQLDTAEWLRGQALTTGVLNWTFNGIKLDVNYNIPAGNLFPQRTGTSGYGGSASTFWADHRSALTKLKNSVRAILAHPNTINMIVSNTVNNIVLTAQDLATGSYSFVKNLGNVATGPFIPSPDTRERVQIIGYGMQGEVLDPATPTLPELVNFLPEGLIVYIGNPTPRGFQVGLGSQVESETNELPIGHTHVGPTTEGGGRPGRWSQVYTPDNLPMQIHGRTAANILPVIEDPAKLAVLSTVMV